MIHEMRLFDIYFDKLKTNKKSIEYRLYDEKRKKLKIGDYILFKKASNDLEAILVKITDLKIYDDLLSMYKANFENDLKKYYSSPEEVLNDTTYYKEAEILSSKAIAIFFKIV